MLRNPFRREDSRGAPEPSRPSDKESEIVSLVRERYAYSRQSKLVMAETWATCLAFYVGEHWRAWDRQARKLVRDDLFPSWRVRMKENQVPGIMDSISSRLIRSREVPVALPLTDDEDDELAADGGTAILKHWWHRNMQRVEHEANINRQLFGAAYIQDYWDPSKTAWVPMNGGAPQLVPVGDVCPELLTVFDVFPEPGETNHDASWIVVAKRKPVQWFKDTFGKDISPDKGAENDLLTSVLPDMLRTDNKGAGAPEGVGQATLLTYFEKPTKKYPKGRHYMIAGETFLWGRDQLPMPHGELPVTEIGYRYVPKRQWPKGLVEEIIDPQRELNRGQSNLMELFRIYRSPKRWIDNRWGIKPNAITDAPDEVVEGNYGGQNPAQYVESPPNLPPWVANYSELQRQSIQQLAGLHEVSEGSAPPGVSAASAINLLQRAEAQRLSAPALMGKIGLEELARKVLTDIVELYREPRLFIDFGKNKQREILALQGSDVGRRDVLVELTEGVEDNEQVRQEQLLAYYGSPAAQQPVEMQIPLLEAAGLQWIAKAIQEGYPAAQQAQQQQLAQEQAMMQQEAEMQAQQQQAELEGKQQEQALKAQAAEQQAAISANAAATQQETQQAQAEQQLAQQDQAHAQALQQAEEKHRADLAQKAMQMQLQAIAARQKAKEQARAAKSKPRPTAGARK